MTHPALDAQSGATVEAVRTLRAELSHDYSEIRSAEIQLTEAILSAHAVTVSARERLQDIQRQLVEAINNPVAALDTPAGERHFLLFLRGKVAEIQAIVDTGALTDEDHARLTRALASGYLLSPSRGAEPAVDSPAALAPSGGVPMTDQGACIVPALGSALGALPQAAQGATAAPAQGASGLAGAASPLAGLASGLLDRGGDATPADDRTDEAPDTPARHTDDAAEADDNGSAGEADDGPEDDGRPEEDDANPRPAEPREHDGRSPPGDGPAPTRPARLR